MANSCDELDIDGVDSRLDDVRIVDSKIVIPCMYSRLICTVYMYTVVMSLAQLTSSHE